MSAPDDSSAAAIVLPEHRFAQAVSGPSYTLWARATTASTVASLLLYGGQVLLKRPDVAWPVLMLMAAGGGVLLMSTWYILTGKTTIDGRGIRQDWLTPKEFAWHEISRVRLVRMPLVPRLVVMTGRGPFKAVHGGNKTLVDAFREVESFYRR